MSEGSELELLRAILRQDLYRFVQKAFYTLSPGSKICARLVHRGNYLPARAGSTRRDKAVDH
jgi:hypothetical protein